MRSIQPPSLIVLACLAAAAGLNGDEPTFVRTRDIIYDKQGGFALTMDQITPKTNPNGAAIILVMSGGWFSNHDFTRPHDNAQLPALFEANARELLNRGYTLFYVVHGSQPKFTVREIHAQLSEAVRHIRRHAAEERIDPDRIGIFGGSAGGHLSLMQGTRGESGSDRVSSRVQAVVAYFPPTDFLNYGQAGVFFDKVVREVQQGKNPYQAALDYVEYDPVDERLEKVTDESRLAEHYKFIAPLYHVTPDDAPALLLHGDIDRLVPLQQSEIIAAKFKEAGVSHHLYIKENGDHGWTATAAETSMVADWFDEHLVD